MRIVRWHPQERVDKPDPDAVSYLVLGEFRRTLRAVVVGDTPYIVTGYNVEPESPVTTRVVVNAIDGFGERASALGAELTASGLDTGQLIGDRDSSFLLEGPAQQILDFVAQPIGTYTVELRFVYSDAINDNRAFWNPAGSTEFIANVATRTVSSWQIQFVNGAPSGGEWIPLATVNWSGAVIAAGDITDLRVFAWEGANPWQQATQTGTGGVEDFGRGAVRSDPTQGRHRLRDAVRALQRQIQDLKGPNELAQWDWFSRPAGPFDPNNTLPAAQTKTLRSIDTVTFTVGDGVSTFGDFNGTGGLNDCLDHLASVPAALRAERVEIVVHGGVTQAINGSKIIAGGTTQPLTLAIRAGFTHSTTNAGLFGRPVIEFDGGTIGAGQFGLLVTTSGLGNLVLRGLDVRWTGTSAAGRGCFGANGYVEAHDTDIRHGVGSPAVDAGYALISTLARKCVVRNCFVQGRIAMYDDPSTGARADEREMGVIEHSRLEASQIVLHADTPGVPGIDAVNGFAIRNCVIEGRGTAPYTGSLALIDARCARKLRIENCSISYGTNENAIDGRTYSSTTPFDWQINGCTFSTGVSNGAHAAGAGTSGALGTGWAVAVQDARVVALRDCTFSITTTDAGGVLLYDVTGYSLDALVFGGCGHGAGGADDFDGVRLTGATACVDGVVRGCVFRDWLAGTTRARAMNIGIAARLLVSGTKFIGEEFGGTPLSLAATYSAVRLSNIEDVSVETCVFTSWNRDDAFNRVITLEAGGGTKLALATCTFTNCGQAVLDRTAGTWNLVTIDDCTVFADAVTGTAQGFDLQAITLTRATNNSFAFLIAPTRDAIVISTVNFLVMGNVAPNGDIRRVGVPAGRGYNEAGQDLNLVNAYT